MRSRYVVSLGWLLLVVMVATAWPVTRVAAASGTVEPPQGTQGTQFTFTASGYRRNERVDVWVTRPDATSIAVARFHANQDGVATWNWVAPGDAPNGTWVMVGRGVDTSLRVSIRFEIQGTPTAPRPLQSVTPTMGAPGTTFTFTAGGFQAGERVGPWLIQPDGSTVSLPDRDQSANLRADETGYATWTWTAPDDAPGGNWASQARGRTSQHLVSIPFQVTPAATPPPAMIENVTPTSGTPGTVFTFTVGGFIPGEEVGSWLNPPSGGDLEATSYMIADRETGVVSWTWQAPADVQGGLWRMNVRGQTSRRLVTLTFEITGAVPPPPLPQLITNVDPPSGLPGTTFHFYAEGFQPGETFFFWAIDPRGNPFPNASDPRAHADGVAIWSWTAPDDAREGQWLMNVRGGVSRVEHQIAFTITRPEYVPPETGVEPGTGGPGTTFKFAARGYRGSEYIDWWLEGPAGAVIPGTVRDVKANSDGYVEFRWRAPDDIAAGDWRLFMRGRDSLRLRTIDLVIVRDTPPPPPPTAGVTPESGSPGTTFTFFAEGFKAGEMVGYWLSDPNNQVVRTDREVMANSRGVITWEWTAPDDAPPGEWRMIARSNGRLFHGGPSRNNVMYIIPFRIDR